MKLKSTGKSRFEFRKARCVLCSPPLHRGLAIGQLVWIQPNVHVAIWLMISAHAASKEIDGHARRWFDPIRQALGYSFQFVACGGGVSPP